MADHHVRPAHVADGEDQERAEDDAPLSLEAEVRTPHGQQVRVDLPHGLVAGGEAADGDQCGDQDPDHADDHDDGLHEVGVGHRQVAAEERVKHDHANGDGQGEREGHPGHHLQSTTAGNELGQDIEEHAEQRHRCGDQPDPLGWVAVFQVFNGGDRAQDLRELAHPAAQHGQVQDAAAQVTQGVPHAEVALRIAQRAGAHEHVAGHGGALQAQCGDSGAQAAPAQQVPLRVGLPALHRPEADPGHGEEVDHQEGQFQAHFSPPRSSRFQLRLSHMNVAV